MSATCCLNCFGFHLFEDECMGTKFSILIDEDNSSKAKLAAQSAFMEADRLNFIFSDYLDSSELSRFSDSSYTEKCFKLSDELFSVLSFGQSISHDTNGSFDMTLGLLSRLWRIARFRNNAPNPDKIRTALSHCGYRNLKLFKKSKMGRLLTPGVELDLGGIAKGYTADRMLKKLNDCGIDRCLVNAGGDLVVGNPPRNSKGWRIKVGGEKNPLLPSLNLSNTAIATSGDFEQYLLLDGKKYSHLIDPHSGMGLTTQAQVTVIAPSGMAADAYASASIVMGFENSKSYFAGSEGVIIYYVSKYEDEIFLKKIGVD